MYQNSTMSRAPSGTRGIDEAYEHDRQYLLGDDVLVAPVGTQGDPATKRVWFPPGEWRKTLAAVTLFVAALAMPGQAFALPGEPVEWPDTPPADIPFSASERFEAIRFTGPYANHQPVSDTYYPSWGADGNLYSPFMDGWCNGIGAFGGYGASPAFVGVAKIVGDDPEALAFRCTTRPVERAPYDGRYASASLHKDNVWYYGSYTLDSRSSQGMEECGNYCTHGPFVGFDISRDGGLTWEETPHTPDKPLFGESAKDGHRVKLGALHAVDFGKNMEHSPDGKMYLVGHGGGGPDSLNSWINADNVYLVRVEATPETANDESAYEYYAGTDAEGNPRWSDDFAEIAPLLSWPNGRLGSATISYVAEHDAYLLWTSAPTDGFDGRGRYDTMLLESDTLTGPWRHVHYLREFGPQAYFVNVPTKFVEDDGRMWLSWSANYGNDADPFLTMRPFGSSYSWSLREFELLPAE